MMLNATLNISDANEILFVLQDSNLHVTRGSLLIPKNWFEGGNNVEIDTYIDKRYHFDVSYSNNIITLYYITEGDFVDLLTVYTR